MPARLINDVLPLSGSANDFIISGFGTPDVAIIIVSGGVTDSVAASNAILGVGVVDDAADASIGFSAEEGVTTFSNTNRMIWNSGVAIPDPAGNAVTDGIIECSLITDGVRMNVTAAPAGAFNITILLIGGADIAQAEVIIKDDLGNASGDQPVALADTWAAAPDFLFGFTQNGNVAPNSVTGFGIVSLGFSNFTDHGHAALGTFDFSNGYYADTSLSNTYMLSQTFNRSISWTGYPHTPTTTDFQFNMSAAGGNDLAIFVAIGLASGYEATVFDFTVPADPGGDNPLENPDIITEQDSPEFAFVVVAEGPTAYDAIIPGSTFAGFGIVQYDGVLTSAISVAITDATTNLAKSQFSDTIEILASDAADDSIIATPSFDGTNFNWAMTASPDTVVLGIGFAFGEIDATAPVLSAPTGTETGHVTASGTVTTDDGVGDLYYYASVNATESAATIKSSGSNQPVVAAGNQVVAFTGLTPETLYYAHYVHEDDAYVPNQSNVVDSSPGFTTDPDPTPKVEFVSGALPTSGTVDLTIAGFGTPDGVLLIVSGAVLDATSEDDAILVIGMMDDTTQGSIAFTAQNAATSNVNSSLYTALAAAPDPALDATLGFDINGTLITDGVQLSIVDAPDTELRVTAVLLGGAGVSMVEVVIKDDLGTSSGDKEVALSKIWAAAPSLLIGVTKGDSAAPDIVQSEGGLSLGFSNFSDHGGVSFSGVDAASGEYMTALVPNAKMLSRVYNGAVTWGGYPHTPTTTNFQFNMDSSGESNIAMFMAIGIGSGFTASVESITIPSDDDFILYPGPNNPLSSLIATLQGPTSFNSVTSNVDVSMGVTAYDGTTIAAISAAISDSSAKSQHSDSLALLDGDGSSDLVVGIPFFNGNNVEWATIVRPPTALFGVALTIGQDDIIAPILSIPTGEETGHNTGSGTVTTNEGTGTLYYYASINATETAGDIVTNGSSQAVNASGVQNVTFTGLTASTLYYAHYVHDDTGANRSNVVDSSPGFTTDAAPVSASGNVADEIYRVYGTDIASALATHFSKTASESLQDAERRWLIAQGGSGGTLEDMWVEVYAPGSSIEQAQLVYWKTQ